MTFQPDAEPQVDLHVQPDTAADIQRPDKDISDTTITPKLSCLPAAAVGVAFNTTGVFEAALRAGDQHTRIYRALCTYE